jgi:hypothetical protein
LGWEQQGAATFDAPAKDYTISENAVVHRNSQRIPKSKSIAAIVKPWYAQFAHWLDCRAPDVETDEEVGTDRGEGLIFGLPFNPLRLRTSRWVLPD